MRSKLFVPGSRPELFAKALTGPADAISIDLEDAVEESRKAHARAATASFLGARTPAADGKVIIIRINGLTTPHFTADLEAVVGANVDLINLPMVAAADDVRAASAAIARLEGTRGLARPVRLLVSIETPRALRLAAEIGSADAAGCRPAASGSADLFEPIGIDRANATAVQQVQLAVKLAAAEAGVWAFDSAYANVADADGYRAEAEVARRLGFIGKSCIHPSQVALANAVFRPSERAIAHSLRVVAAARDATAKGIGAYMVDGRMVDAPFVRRAEDVVALAGRLGLLPEGSARA